MTLLSFSRDELARYWEGIVLPQGLFISRTFILQMMY